MYCVSAQTCLRLLLVSLGLSLAAAVMARPLPLHLIELPEGFEISVYAQDVPGARSMVISPGGIVYVGTRREGKVYALVDEDHDFRIDRRYTLASGLEMPNGVAWRDGALYVAEVSRVLRFDDIEQRLGDPPEPVVVFDDLPGEHHHGWRYIAFGPDGKLYVPIGAPCNVCDEEGYALITRMNPDGSAHEVYAQGVRNTVGFDWHPSTGELWFTDNGRDLMGDNIPPDELNRAPRAGLHFGFPYCHGGTIPDPEYGAGHSCADYRAPVQALGPHVAALGMYFYQGRQFPEKYRRQIFIAEHGSWNRSEKIGYRIMQVELDGNNAVRYAPFARGWLQGEQAWGRPVDIKPLADGSLLVSDDHAGVIYRIAYRR